MTTPIYISNFSRFPPFPRYFAMPTARTPRRACRTRSASFRCCSWSCSSSSSAGRRCTLSTRSHCSTRKPSTKRSATRPSRTSSCSPTRPAAATRLRTASWTAAFARHAWIYFGAARSSTRRGASASAAGRLAERKAVKWHSCIGWEQGSSTYPIRPREKAHQRQQDRILIHIMR